MARRTFPIRWDVNGLTSAPRTFTKLLTPIFAHLRQQGHECFGYIDDTFILADTFQEAENSCKILAHTLDNLGFVIQEDKSVFIPSQQIVFLGFKLDSKAMTVKLTQAKLDKFSRTVQALKSCNRPTIRAVAGLIGLMTAYIPAVPRGAAYIKTLEIAKNKALKFKRGNFDAKMSIPTDAWTDINWWVINLPHARRHIQVPRPEITIYTDASLMGWGAYTHQSDSRPITTGGRWKPEETAYHINVLELKAIHHGLRSLVNTSVSHVKVMTDNTTAIAYIKNMGGVQSEDCNKEAKRIWQYCEQHNMWL